MALKEVDELKNDIYPNSRGYDLLQKVYKLINSAISQRILLSERFERSICLHNIMNDYAPNARHLASYEKMDRGLYILSEFFQAIYVVNKINLNEQKAYQKYKDTTHHFFSLRDQFIDNYGYDEWVEEFENGSKFYYPILKAVCDEEELLVKYLNKRYKEIGINLEVMQLNEFGREYGGENFLQWYKWNDPRNWPDDSDRYDKIYKDFENFEDYDEYLVNKTDGSFSTKKENLETYGSDDDFYLSIHYSDRDYQLGLDDDHRFKLVNNIGIHISLTPSNGEIREYRDAVPLVKGLFSPTPIETYTKVLKKNGEITKDEGFAKSLIYRNQSDGKYADEVDLLLRLKSQIKSELLPQYLSENNKSELKEDWIWSILNEDTRISSDVVI
jgi:hypothetical protein